MRPRKSPFPPLTCEFRFREQLYKGVVSRLYPNGFFVETDAEIERSTVLEVRVENPESGRAVVAESVVERRLAPAPQQLPGLELRLFHLSVEYGELVGEWAPTPSRSTENPSERNEPGTGEPGEDAGLETGEVPAAPNRVPDRARAAAEVPLQERAGEPVFDEESPIPRAVVIDDGELADVVAILEQLGVPVHRATPAVDGEFPDWIAPSHLLVVSDRRALSLGDSLDLESAEFTALVVTDSDARALHPIVHQLGYRFVVRRPVHPEALRTLMRQALHRDSSRRGAPRVAIGCRAHWKLFGMLRRREGTLVDLSVGSCQLLVDERVPIGSRVRIRIPAPVTGRRRVDLAGRVVRRGAVSREQRALGVVFEALSRRMQEQLARLVEAFESGPSRSNGGVEGEASLAASLAADAAPAQTDGDDVPRAERRREKRAAFPRELVALDAGTEEVRLSLIGRDLSVGGMRVEPNPELEVDDQLRLAFYDCEEGDPLLLHAVVTRDDGRLGTCLRFIGLEPDARARLERAVLALPSIESVEGDDPEAAWAAIGQVELLPESLD